MRQDEWRQPVPFRGSGVLNVVEAYDPASNTWSTKAAMPTARDRIYAVVKKGIVGGCWMSIEFG